MHPPEAEQLVREVLSKQHFEPCSHESSPDDDAPDLVYSHPRGQLFIWIKQVGTSSIADVLGRFALSLLEVRQRVYGSSIPLHVVVLPRLGQKTRKAVQEFMSLHSPQSAWGLIDHAGSVFISIPTWDFYLDEPSEDSLSHWPRNLPQRLFTDLNRWMLKVLLLAEAPPSQWGGPIQHVSTPTELHRVAGVSVEKAHQFFRAFEDAGHIRRTRTRIEVVHKRTLMDKWFHDEQVRPPIRIPTRWIFGEPSNLDQIFLKQGTSSAFAVCGFEACSRMQLLHAPIPRREIYVSIDPSKALVDWDLEQCPEHSAHVYLRHMNFPESIMRGRHVTANFPVVDVLQAALDVCNDAARGREQAEYLLAHVLKWNRDT